MVWAKWDSTSRAKWDHDVPLYCLKNIKMKFVLSSQAYNISLTLFSRCTSSIVIIEKYYLINHMHEECIFIQVRYNTAISPTRYSYITNLQDRLLYLYLYNTNSVCVCVCVCVSVCQV